MPLKQRFEYFTEERKAQLLNKRLTMLYISGSLALLILLLVNICILLRTEKSHKDWNTTCSDKSGKNSPGIDKVRGEFDRINGLMDRKNFAWSRFLSRLEGTTPGRISVASINPSFTNGSVVIDGTAFTIDDLVKFMKNLQSSAYFSDVFLSEQRNVASGNVAFTISFRYLDKESK